MGPAGSLYFFINSFLSFVFFVPIELVDSYVTLLLRCRRIWLCLITFKRAFCEEVKSRRPGRPVRRRIGLTQSSVHRLRLRSAVYRPSPSRRRLNRPSQPPLVRPSFRCAKSCRLSNPAGRGTKDFTHKTPLGRDINCLLTPARCVSTLPRKAHRIRLTIKDEDRRIRTQMAVSVLNLEQLTITVAVR